MDLIGLIDRFPFGEPAERGFFLYKLTNERQRRGMQEANFRATVRYAYEKSPFYRKKFDERGIVASKVHSPEDLGDFYTTPEDLRADPESFVCAPPDTAFETTGTTSKRPKRVYFSRREIHEAGWAGAVGLWALGVRKTDRFVSAFDYSFWVSGPVLQASCQVLGVFHIEAGRMDPVEFHERVRDYKPTVIVGDPSWIVRFSEIAREKGTWPVTLLLAGGENLNEEARSLVEKVWKADFLLSYGQTEAFGAIGMESRAKEGYHLNEFHNFFEIVSPDTPATKPAGPSDSADGFVDGSAALSGGEGWGELAYTTLNRRVMPLVRYRSGDVTRILTTPSTGLPGRRIAKLRGRVDEWTVTAMGNIAPWMFEPVFKRIGGLAPDWQIQVAKEGPKDLVTFHVEAENGDASLKDRVFAELRREFPEAFRVTEMGLLKLDFRAHAPGTLREGRKLRRIVDHRQF